MANIAWKHGSFEDVSPIDSMVLVQLTMLCWFTRGYRAQTAEMVLTYITYTTETWKHVPKIFKTAQVYTSLPPSGSIKCWYFWESTTIPANPINFWENGNGTYTNDNAFRRWLDTPSSCSDNMSGDASGIPSCAHTVLLFGWRALQHVLGNSFQEPPWIISTGTFRPSCGRFVKLCEQF